MRKYYLFTIRKRVVDTYQENISDLYNHLYRLFKNNRQTINYKFNFYKQLCVVFKPDVIEEYFKKQPNVKYKNNKFLIKKENEINLIEIKYACIIIVSNVNIPSILKSLNYYNKNIFICDFENEDYFWLNDLYNRKILYEYN